VQAGTTGISVGELIIGVRATHASVMTRLRELIPSHVVEGAEPPANLSLLIGAEDRARRELHTLARDGVRMLRTDSIGRLLRAALFQLDSYAPPPPNVHALRGRVLVKDGAAVVVDIGLAEQLSRIERRLGDAGFQIADAGCAFLDATTDQVVFEPLRLDIDAAALEWLEQDEPRAERELVPASAQLPMRALVARLRGNGTQSPTRRLTRLAAIGVDQRGRVNPDAVEYVHGLDQRGLVLDGDGRTDRELFELLRSVT
jgi:hypothetical protein